ncbi:MAG: chemotaxis protein CheW [Myxococcota bacterium]
MEEPDEITTEFLVESYENLDQLDQELVALETTPGDTERIASIFRTIHTIKGTSGFLGFAELERVAHVGENLLSRLRDGVLALDEARTTVLLRMVDAVRTILGEIERNGSEGDARYDDLVADLERLQDPDATDAPAAPPPPKPKSNAAAAASPGGGAGPPNVSDSSIRVDVGLLDELMNLVGELVLARNQILQHAAGTDDTTFVSTTQRLSLITTELQEGLMKTRMQPIGHVWNKFPRVVRDLALTCDKQVRIKMEGNETELDRTILEAIKDPLTHVVRNAIDHGIETPAARVAAGKDATGSLSMRAYHEGGQVNIEISDDGAGVDLARVKAKAIGQGLISEERAQRMSDRELAMCIFMPGFSTAAQVTSVSGRGVGMDVVRTNIEKIGGVVDIVNRPGRGMTLKIKIPLTLAIIPALVVGSGGERFAIPQVNLLELVRLEGTAAASAVETIHGIPVYRLRGHLLPLAYLGEQLGMSPTARADGDHRPALNIVVLQADDRSFGLVVDEVFNTEEIVVKPLGPEIKKLSTYAGTTIMGDGRVALILDVLGIAKRARIVAEGHARGGDDPPAALPEDKRAPTRTMLLFRAGLEGRLAVPLDLVSRLEEVSEDRIERAGGHHVVQYRGGIMPLIDVRASLGLPAPADPEPLRQVIVHARGDRAMGLVVDTIVDIVEDHVDIERIGGAPGRVGSAVIQGHVTDLVDVRGLIERVDPTFFREDAA